MLDARDLRRWLRRFAWVECEQICDQSQPGDAAAVTQDCDETIGHEQSVQFASAVL